MQIPSVSDMNLRHKFFLWSALILVLFSLLLSLLYYRHMKAILIREAFDTSQVILQEVEAIREYVKEVLRPRMEEMHRDDIFILEAMSTTHVSLSIMKRFSRRMKGYVFRRVSLNPLNPDNMANAFEEEMFDWFEEHPDRHLWQGIVRRNGKAFFVSMEPDYVESACLRCHGDYRRAPMALVERYGTGGGFRFREGDLGGIDSVSIPVTAAFVRITRDTFLVFLVIFGSSMLALFLLNLLFDRLVISRLNRVSASLVLENGTANEAEKKPVASQADGDELENLRLSLSTLSRYVRVARKGSGLQPDFMGPYTVGPPLVPGTLSWLFQGTDTRTDRQVTLKLGFDEVMVNPLYAACFRAELKIMNGVRHNNLMRALAREGDMLALEPVRGHDLQEWIDTHRQDIVSFMPLFEQLCDLLTTLHWAGVVHHDLRPGVFLVTGDAILKLFDMGYAYWREIPDVIRSSGFGPSGDLRYMAPELLQGRRGDPRSDIYSLGILLYRVVTGREPFVRQEVPLVTWLGMKKDVPLPGTIRPDISPGLEQVIVRAMAWDMEERYQWVEDLRDDLRDLI